MGTGKNAGNTEKVKCTACGSEVKSNCDWRQGRCPHRPISPVVQRIINFFKALSK